MGELILLAIIVVAGLAWVIFNRTRSWMNRPALESADFVVFKTESVLLPDLQQDMSDAGWKLVASSGDEGALLYRFERSGVGAATLASIMEADGVMQRIANRTTGADVILAVDEFGSRKAAHA